MFYGKLCSKHHLPFFFSKEKEKLPQILPFVCHPLGYLIWSVQCKSQEVWTLSSCEYKQDLQDPVITSSHEVLGMYFPQSIS